MAEFDERLKQRLLAFQRHHGLAGQGVADAETWTRLVAGAPDGPSEAGQNREDAGQGTIGDAGSVQDAGQAQPQLSPDGRWWWDGAHWLPAAEGTALLGSRGHGHAGDLGDRDGWPKPLQLPLGPAVGPQGSKTPGPTSSSTDDELTGFATNSAELTDHHRKVLDAVAADLKAHPLTNGGFVTLTGGTDRRGDEAANVTLGQDRAEAARRYLQDLVPDEETKQAIRAYSLGEPGDGPERDDPTLRRVDIVITRRGYDVDMGPHPSQPLRKTGRTPWDFTKEENERRGFKRHHRRPDPNRPEWPDWFWKEVEKWPPGPSLISEISALLNETLGTGKISRLAGRIARAFHLTPAQAAEIEKTLNDAFQDGGEIAVKALAKGIIEKGVGEETEKPANPYGPTTEPDFPEPEVQPKFPFDLRPR